MTLRGLRQTLKNTDGEHTPPRSGEGKRRYLTPPRPAPPCRDEPGLAAGVSPFPPIDTNGKLEKMYMPGKWYLSILDWLLNLSELTLYYKVKVV